MPTDRSDAIGARDRPAAVDVAQNMRDMDDCVVDTGGRGKDKLLDRRILSA
jgi:hypothetical protein